MSNIKKIKYDSSKSIVLENEKLKIHILKDKPAIAEYELKGIEGQLRGDISGMKPEIAVYKGLKQVLPDHLSVIYHLKALDGRVLYAVKVKYDNSIAVSFNLTFELSGKGVCIEFNDVIEKKDFHLMSFQMPSLLSVMEDENTARLAIPSDCGRLIDVKKASCNTHKFNIDWEHPVLTGFAYTDKVIGIVETDSIENQVVCSVYEKDGEKAGSLSVNIIYRHPEFDLAEYGHKVPALEPEYHLKVQDSCRLYVNVLGDYDNDGEVSWTDAASYLQQGVEAQVNPYYTDKMVSKIAVAIPTESVVMTFTETLDYIRKLASLTDYNPMVLYLVGWQYEGHDTGYPAVDKVNESVGTYEQLLALMEEAYKYNVVISFHDNYDDAYLTSPAWDPEIISRDPQGNFMKNGNFAGGQAYLISNYKYALKYGVDRVRYTLKRYHIKETYHIDVLSGAFKSGRRYDYNPHSPAAAEKNLEGKLMIVDEFRKNEVDVTTEDFSTLFLGKISQFWSLAYKGGDFFEGEEKIPLVPFIYHGKVGYGRGLDSDTDMITELLHGTKFSRDCRKDNLNLEICGHYLVTLPLVKFYDKVMTGYQKHGSVEKVVYEGGNYIELDLEAKQYKVVYDGRIIADSFTSFVPVKEDVFLAYSKYGGLMEYPLPEHWKAADIEVLSLKADGSRHSEDFTCKNGTVVINAEAGVPYKITLKD